MESLERVEQSKLAFRVLEAMVNSPNQEASKLVRASDVKTFVISHLDGIIRSFKMDRDYHKIGKYLRALNLFFRIPENEQDTNKCVNILVEHFKPQTTTPSSSSSSQKKKKKGPQQIQQVSQQKQLLGKQFRDCCQYIDSLKKPSKTFDEETPLFIRQELSTQSQELVTKLKHWGLW